ncbi:hypothetical protein IQ07DRAFT_586053 [Pyrenochaeta sp. DS3sAY3a]|nr:hypothetical protein IQ07DRAFT_586053 [Pyrenochaeta sp. DS3sAY3a]
MQSAVPRPIMSRVEDGESENRTELNYMQKKRQGGVSPLVSFSYCGAHPDTAWGLDWTALNWIGLDWIGLRYLGACTCRRGPG